MTSVTEIDQVLSEEDFQRIKKLLFSWGGITLNASKKAMVGNRLNKRLRALGLGRYHAYLDLVECSQEEQEHFINALTTNLTAFFREEHHFQVLADYLRQHPGNRPINIWSSAASTGEEPYSIAMTVIDTLGEKDARRVKILASDLDTKVLAHAESGIYSLERLAKLPAPMIRRYFLRGIGKNEGTAKIKPEVRALVTFRQINLLAPNWPVPETIDVLFCRNVMIYFDKATQKRVLERFAPLLVPDGLLIAGHSESYAHVSHLFRLCGKSIYKLANKRK